MADRTAAAGAASADAAADRAGRRGVARRGYGAGGPAAGVSLVLGTQRHACLRCTAGQLP